MADRKAAAEWVGHRLEDVYGGRLGKVEDVYLDSRSEEPVWLLARLGRFGDEHVAIPVAEAVAALGSVWVPHERQTVKAAPRVAPGSAMTRETDLALASHYGTLGRRQRELGDAPEGSVTCVSSVARGTSPTPGASGSARRA